MSFDLPDLPNGWSFASLESCSQKGSITYGIVQPGSQTNSGVPIIRVNNFRDTRIDVSDVMKVAPEIAAKYERTRLKGGEVLLTVVGTVGQVAVAPSSVAGYNVARAVAVIHPLPHVSAEWIALCLRSPYSQYLLGSRANTTVQTTINLKDLRALPIPLPSERERVSITEMVGAIDDRITLLRETNTTLEAIAQALFKSWFVDFDPVHAKMQGRAPEGMDQATAALFPDRFEESELGSVPLGWPTGKLADIASLKGGKMLDKTSFSDSGANPVFGGAGVMGFSDLSNSEGFVITVGRVGAYCGQYFWHQGRAWVNNNASLVSPINPDDSCWLFLWLKNVDMDLIKKGAAQPFVSNGDISDRLQMCLMPPPAVIDAFDDIVFGP
jgi:type I restriction enzyme, S subunit